MGKKASEAVTGEALDVLLCGQPLAGEEKEPVKAMLLSILKEKYDLEEEDMLSAGDRSWCLPTSAATSVWIGSMLLGYGHDDRVCAYCFSAKPFSVCPPCRSTPVAVCLRTRKKSAV